MQRLHKGDTGLFLQKVGMSHFFHNTGKNEKMGQETRLSSIIKFPGLTFSIPGLDSHV